MTNEMFEKISTLVFLDLEATGLPSDVGLKNVNITEMSLVAIDRTDFESDRSLRILNKISLCVQPRAPVSPPAMTITGLYNDSLENQGRFDDSIPKMFEYFFRRLRTPICLLAHNGRRYDFPLLQAELKRVNYALDPRILCADTLEAFRSIAFKLNQSEMPIPVENGTNVNPRTPESPSNIDILSQLIDEEDDLERLLSDDMHLFADVVEPVENVSSEYDITKANVLTPRNPGIAYNPLKDEKTPPKPPSQETLMPIRRSNKAEPSVTPQNHSAVTTDRSRPHAKRKLFDNGTRSNCVAKTRSPKIVSFSLEKLYMHFFGETPPISHYAESDCLALSKVCQRVYKDFLQWVDENNSSFSTVTPMW